MGLSALAMPGCGKVPDLRDRMRIIINYRHEQDFPEDVPYVQTQNEPKVQGLIRKGEARKQIGGLLYGGERIDVIRKHEFKAPGTPMCEVLVRRFKEPQPHIDVRVNCGVLFEVFFSQFSNGRVVNVETGETMKPRYFFDPGVYHLKAYK
jgi:hypothetical protein